MKEPNFREVLEKHGLESQENAEKISRYITDKDKKGFSLTDFAQEFDIPKEDAKVILETIYKAMKHASFR